MRLSESYLLKEVAGECVLFPVGQSIIESKRILSVNETGRFILEQLSSDTNNEEILQSMVREYEAEPSEVDILKEDMENFLHMLRMMDMLVE